MGRAVASCRVAVSVVLLATVVISSAAVGGAVPEPPPEPQYPDQDGMSEQAHRAWWTAHQAWEAGLTVAQKLELDRREKDAAEREFRGNSLHDMDLPGPDSDWREHAELWKVAPAGVVALEAHGVAFGSSVKQSFDPYLGGPVFITSDSLLNAFHVLFEDSFRELELRRAARFRRDFEGVLGAVRRLREQGAGYTGKDPLMPRDRFDPAMRMIELVLGPALVLSGTPPEFFAEAQREEIVRQVTAIREAGDTALPAWLQPGDPGGIVGLEYARCRPVGFYADSERLSDYFRAVRWLQMIPFRASRRHEYDAMVLLGFAASRGSLGSWLEATERLIGPVDDPTMLELAKVLELSYRADPKAVDSGSLSVRLNVARAFIDRGYYRINSDLRLGRTMEQTFYDLTFRVLSGAALADAAMFQGMLDRNLEPSGLAVAAMLGSDFAADRLGRDVTEVVRALDSTATDMLQRWEWSSAPQIYLDYLGTLRALFEKADPAAPAFMHTDLWAAKNCQTALAGWAQMRHTFTLQAKLTRNYLGLVMAPPGFVEPNPEFFARMESLVTRAHQAFEVTGAFEPSGLAAAEAIRAIAVRLRETAGCDDASIGGAFRDRFALLGDETDDVIAEAIGNRELRLARDTPPEVLRVHLLDLANRLQARARQFEDGEVIAEPGASSLPVRWSMLGRLAGKLEALAHKQLRAEPWTPEEVTFLKDYGKKLANVMGYFGNAYLSPEDDAPRWAEVCAYPDRGTSLIAAVGRPRMIYVLYPWNGVDILCRGSVMQYYEFESAEKMTDREWRDRLDAPECPALPEWIAAIAGPPRLERQREGE